MTTGASNKQPRKRSIRLLCTGFIMGIADLVPGVSGGTIAFIAGIYEELITSIKTVTNTAVVLVLKGRIKEAFLLIPFTFLLPLGIGILVALFSMAHLLSWLIQTHPTFVWAFFFGLVLASIWVILQRITRVTFQAFAFFIFAGIVAFLISGLTPTEAPSTLLYIFLSGAIAISAMILPGISGSFILIILGTYEHILTATAERDILVLVIFILGACTGLALFSRFIYWLFKTYHNATIALLSGFMFGSLRTLWPWKDTVEDQVKNGETIPLVQVNTFPSEFTFETIAVLLFALTGFLCITFLHIHVLRKERINGTVSHTA